MQVNLRAALESYSLDVTKVYELLRESEENGPQHIFYLRCSAKDVQTLLTVDYVRRGVFGIKTPQESILNHEPIGFAISEVRPWSEKKPTHWALKDLRA